MPGLRLTPMQASRLWGLDSELCVRLLTHLVDVKFLTRTRDGSFMQLDRTQARTPGVERALVAGS
jgi:hypothetical protein